MTVMRCLWLLVATGCSGLPAPTTSATTVHLEGKPLAVPGETMEFRVTLRGIAIGLVQTAVGKPGWVDGRRAIIVRSHGKTDGVLSLIGDLAWDLTTTIDLERGAPIDDHEESWLAFRDDHEHERTDHTWDADDRHHDIHSAVTAVRGWQAEVGQRAELDVAIAGARLRAGLWRAGSGYLASAKQPAVRYDGSVRDRFHFVAWLSDDAARVPLRLETESELGGIAVELVDYRVPAD